LLLYALACVPLMPAQSRARSRAQARAVPAAKASPLSVTNPTVQPGESAKATYPAMDTNGVPALVLHGQRPGPIIAYLFHGFSTEEAFFAEMDAIFGKLNPAQMQGAVLALSLPGRPPCADQCPDDTPDVFQRLAPSILNDCRFVVQLHQQPLADALPPHAFLYPATENAKLANYVESMARASLVPHLVTMAALEAPVEALQHLAPQSIDLQHPAISIETATLEGNSSPAAVQLRKGLVNLLHHLKMAPGAVSWQNAVQRVQFSQLRARLLSH
jgi:hypothetical protein